jgi:fructose-1,6-bisphosphatase II
MREALDAVPISGALVIGRGDAGHALREGSELGSGGHRLDLACDPVGNGTAVAGGRPGALSILAASDPGGMMQVPRMYMRKMAVGPVAKGRIDLRRPVRENLEAIADAFGRKVADVTAIVLDRTRHDDLVAEIREAGARIKLIADGDIMASISAAIRGTNDHLAIGIGGAPEGIIAAAALRCLGGEIQGQLWPMSRTEINRAAEDGIDDVSRIFGIDDLVRGHQTVVATGISGGDLLRGVRYMADGARTQSVVLCSRCNRVRFIDSIHLFSGDRHEEIRL